MVEQVIQSPENFTQKENPGLWQEMIHLCRQQCPCSELP